jgi:nucleotide-binding universal stress UspA family protein
MEKKLLLAIDGSKNSLMTLDYVNRLFQFCPEVKLVLFHVLPSVPPIYKEEGPLDPMVQSHLQQWKKRHQEAIERILRKSKEKLVKLGWPESQIQIRTQEKRIGPARDILFEADKGMVDAIVMGRRGLSKLAELFLGSISNKVIQGTKEAPVWVVGGKVTTPRILVAIDGSENSNRAADHLSFILGSCKDEEMKILLLNVWPGFITFSGPGIIPDLSDFPTSRQKYEEKANSFLDECEGMLLKAGFSPNMIKKKIYLKGADIGKAILSEAQKGDYGTIVMGRRGISKAKEFFMGSVSSKILQQAGDKVIWIVS